MFKNLNTYIEASNNVMSKDTVKNLFRKYKNDCYLLFATFFLGGFFTGLVTATFLFTLK